VVIAPSPILQLVIPALAGTDGWNEKAPW